VWRKWADEVAAEAVGRGSRLDPVVAGSGGPAGNARLTAWTGAILLVLFLAELVTALNVEGMISWHVVIGVLLVPPALLKTASTGWRIIRYYIGSRPYRTAGPPSTPLRVLGPLVVLSTLAVLGTGLALIALGPTASRTPLLDVLGYRIDALTLHQGSFIVWAVFTGLHLLARAVPAVKLIGGPRVPGRVRRIGVLGAGLAAAVVAAVLVLGAAGAWTTGGAFPHFPGHHHERAEP
jgi:hypothetical protein